MRITFVHPYAGLNGGVRVVSIYAERLRRRGHHVTVVSTPHRPPTLRARLQSSIRGKDLPKTRPQGPSHFDQLDIDWRIIERWRPVNEHDVPDADVVVATWWETAEWVARLPACKGIHAHLLQHDEQEMYPADNLQMRQRATAAWQLPMCKIAVAGWLAELAKDRCPEDPLWLIPNAVDVAQFNASPRDKRPTPIVGMMYSTTGFKGCDLSINAFNLAAQQVTNLRLMAFGQSESIDALTLPPDIDYICRPPQAEIRDIYANCDAWLFGSRSEGFGLPILEAMACRTPVIATPAGAAPEILLAGGGILLDSYSAESMAAAIVKICRMSSEEWRSISDTAHTIATSYTWENATDSFENALISIVHGRSL